MDFLFLVFAVAFGVALAPAFRSFVYVTAILLLVLWFIGRFAS
jgi:hypothetical protein